MNQEQTLELIPVESLLERVRALRDGGYRLVQIGATRLLERVEVIYSFDLNGSLANLRLHLDAAEPRVPSVSAIYGCAVLYENEMHDLFKIEVAGIALDFHGNLYKTKVKFPFGTIKAPVSKTSAAPAAPAAPAEPTAPARPTASANVPAS